MVTPDLDVKKPLAEHLNELRQRFFWLVVIFIVGSVAGYIIRQPIQDLLLKPLNQPLFYTAPTGGFDFVLNISLFCGFILVLPALSYQLIRFIEPILPRPLRRMIVLAVFASLLLVLAGTSFGYYVSLPAALHFLNAFNSKEVHSLISAHEYLSFIFFYLAGFALIFQLPLILLFFNAVTRLPAKKLWQIMPYVVVGSFILAAFTTPTPDPLNQTIMALPMIILYYSSIGLIWFVNRHSSRSS